MKNNFELPIRQGSKPKTSHNIPHEQLDQHGPVELVEKLADWAFALNQLHEEHSRISVPGARALVVDDEHSVNQDAFMVGREFAHIHPFPDHGSMHLKLPLDEAEEVINKGWGEHHTLVVLGHQPPGLIMVFAARNEEELSVVKLIISQSLKYALAA